MIRKIISVAVLILCLNQIAQAEPVEVIPPQNKVLGSSNGRFVFGQISSMRRDQYMLDTKTGRLWQIVKSKDDSIILQIVPYSHLDGTASIVPEDVENAVVYQLMLRNEKKKESKKK